MSALLHPVVEPLHSSFLRLLPRIRLHAQICSRAMVCGHRKADFVAEVIALAWCWYVRLRARGKDPVQFPSALATYAARAVRSGRRLCGQERASAVLAPIVQRRHGFVVASLPSHSTLNGNIWDEALIDNRSAAVPDQVSFRCDFPAWRRTRTCRDRRIIDALMLGEGTQAVARRFAVSPARISQLKREFHEDWTRFCADPPKPQQSAAA